MARLASPLKAPFIASIERWIEEKKDENGKVHWDDIKEYVRRNPVNGVVVTNQTAENWIKSVWGEIIVGKPIRNTNKNKNKPIESVYPSVNIEQQIANALLGKSNFEKLEYLHQLGSIISRAMEEVISQEQADIDKKKALLDQAAAFTQLFCPECPNSNID